MGMSFRNFGKVTISTNTGLVSSGEVCFLPGYCLNDPMAVMEAFYKISQDWEGKEVPTVKQYFEESGIFCTKESPGNLAFALESALFVLCVRIHGWLETTFTPHEIPISGFFLPEFIEKEDEWINLVERGFSKFKCKIASQKQSNNLIKIVRWLKKKYPEKDFEFRLDCNQRFSLCRWKKIALEWEPFPVEYWEEPVKKTSNMLKTETTYREMKIRYAVDESFREKGLPQTSYGPQAIIVKPSIWQGFRKCYRDLEDLCLLYPQKKIVLSSSYEISNGMFHLCLLHKMLGLETHCGFDTLKLFSYVGEGQDLCKSAAWELKYDEIKGFSLQGKSF